MIDGDLLRIVAENLAANYGIAGSLERLAGENLNFLVTDADGAKHVFKIVDEHTPPIAVQMENAAIEYALAAGFEPRLPRILENKYGNIESGIKIPIKGVYHARLMEFVSGKRISDLTDISENLLFNLGQTVAHFDLVMRDFDHPAAHRSHRWNLAEAAQHETRISLLAEPQKRDTLSWAFAEWRRNRCTLGDVPWQFIHGDAHDENVLAEQDRVTGLIDFGDCCYNPAVCELAISLAYLMMRNDDPVRVAARIVAGYRGVRPLTASETALLYPLVCARLAVSLCIAAERRSIDAGNRNWFGSETAAWRLLEQLRELGAAAFASGLLSP